jgi:adenosylcobyric acid synthase
VLDGEDAAMIRGFLINKFRGDVSLFDEGYAEIARRTGWEGLGVVPWITAARQLPAEDAVALDRPEASAGAMEITVPMLSRIANFDDFDPLAAEPGVRLTMVPPGQPIPASVALVVLPGTKSTIADLKFLRAQGWDVDIAAHVRRGGRVLGICGGYQMLGRTIADPEGVEGPSENIAGLGLLPIDTVMRADKTLREVHGTRLADGSAFTGYEIHAGLTTGDAPPLLRMADGRDEGAVSACGRIAGCYIHGLFNLAEQRRGWIDAPSNGLDQHIAVDAALDALASELERHVAVDRLLAIAGEAV